MAAGKGDGKKGGPKKGGGNKGGGKLRQRATNDVQLMMQPQFDYNNAQLQQTQENYLRAQQAAQSASGGAYDAIGDARNPGFDRIADQFTQNLNSLAPEFGGQGAAMPYTSNSIYGERGGTIGMPANEVSAGNALGGAIGQAGLSGLANDDARWGMLREGAQREASIFGRNSQAALQSQMMDVLRQHENEQQNLMAQQPYQIKSRLDELKDQAIEQQLAKSKMRSDRAFSEALQAQLTGMIGGGGPGGSSHMGAGDPPGGGNGNHGNPTGPTGGQNGFGLGDTAAGGNGGPFNQRDYNQDILRATRQASSVSQLPGWVRYAWNHNGAQSLNDPDRIALYRRKLQELLSQKWPTPQIDIPPGPGGLG